MLNSTGRSSPMTLLCASFSNGTDATALLCTSCRCVSVCFSGFPQVRVRLSLGATCGSNNTGELSAMGEARVGSLGALVQEENVSWIFLTTLVVIVCCGWLCCFLSLVAARSSHAGCVAVPVSFARLPACVRMHHFTETNCINLCCGRPL